jgi:hypothetical protein
MTAPHPRPVTFTGLPRCLHHRTQLRTRSAGNGAAPTPLARACGRFYRRTSAATGGVHPPRPTRPRQRP